MVDPEGLGSIGAVLHSPVGHRNTGGLQAGGQAARPTEQVHHPGRGAKKIRSLASRDVPDIMPYFQTKELPLRNWFLTTLYDKNLSYQISSSG